MMSGEPTEVQGVEYLFRYRLEDDNA